jgi:hypothetical protein
LAEGRNFDGMHTMSTKWIITILMLLSMSSFAVPPQMSDAVLQRLATLIVTGTVVRMVETHEENEGVIHFDGIAEIVVETIDKGSGVTVGDTIIARYFHEVPSESNLQGRTTNGHRGIPQQSERVQVFLKESRGKGFDVLMPNGFSKISK